MQPADLNRLFIGFVEEPVPNGDHFIYLVNNTDVPYQRVVIVTGMYTSVDDDLLESSQAHRQQGKLRPRSAVLLEEGPAFGEGRLHVAARRSARMAVLAVRNGPMNRPRLNSSSARASSRAMTRFGVRAIFLP